MAVSSLLFAASTLFRGIPVESRFMNNTPIGPAELQAVYRWPRRPAFSCNSRSNFIRETDDSEF